MKAMIYGAGGGTSSDEVTALKKHVLSPYTTITNDSSDEIVAGIMVDNGAVNKQLNCGENYTIEEGFHDGNGVISANSLASQTGADAAAGDILTGKTAWVNGIKLTGTLPMMAGGTKTPSTSQITVACSGYKMTSDIIIPAFSLPTASKLLNGYVYSIYGKSVTGTAQVYTQTPTDIRNNTGGVIDTYGYNTVDSNGILVQANGVTANTIRTNNAFNLSNYLYLKAVFGARIYSGAYGLNVKIGVSKNANNTGITWSNSLYVKINGGTLVLDVSALSGMYFIYIYALCDSNSSSSQRCYASSMYLSNS